MYSNDTVQRKIYDHSDFMMDLKVTSSLLLYSPTPHSPSHYSSSHTLLGNNWTQLIKQPLTTLPSNSPPLPSSPLFPSFLSPFLSSLPPVLT